ncbi:hypothetical protein [Endozoicomonas sp. ALC066]|uniref:hypothetical protein n=1 Tax=Endozoicomonas sp. ALC066 TaxID=3403078 RepID=UPI003BB702FC
MGSFQLPPEELQTVADMVVRLTELELKTNPKTDAVEFSARLLNHLTLQLINAKYGIKTNQ